MCKGLMMADFINNNNNINNNNLATYIAQVNPAIVAAQGAHTNNITTYSSYTIIQ